MARTEVSLNKYAAETDGACEVLDVTANQTTIDATLVLNGLKITDAFKCKDNTLTIEVSNTYASTSSLGITIGAGNYPNAILGSKVVTCPKDKTTEVAGLDPSRFEQSDGSLLLDFAENFTGSIIVKGKHSGLV